MMRKLVLAASVLAAALATAQAGVDFSRYVAIGDSLTAGYSDSGLAFSHQSQSYPVQLARAARAKSVFEQPLVSEPGIPACLYLRSIHPLAVVRQEGSGAPMNLYLPRPYNNLAVPGATLGNIISTVTDGGGMHDLVLRGLGTQLQQAVALEPTFVTIWAGNNDALNAVLSGRVIEDVTLTSAAHFAERYATLINTIKATGAKIAVANIPDVTSIPYATTLPPVVLNPATSQPLLINGQMVPLLGPDGTPMAGNDLVLLSASAYMAMGCGIPQALGGPGPGVVPACPTGGLPDSQVLSASELATINARVVEYNATIKAAARTAGAAFVDVNKLLKDIRRRGLMIGGADYTSDYLTGGLFSYDAVHPTVLGYGVVADAFVKAINARFGAKLKRPDLTQLVEQPFSLPPAGAAAPSDVKGAIALQDFDAMLDALAVPR